MGDGGRGGSSSSTNASGNGGNRPEWLQQYDLIGKIGEGTYGLVFLVKIKSNRSKSIAIKKFKQSKDGDGISPTAIREIMLLREINHENVVKLVNVHINQADMSLYLAFDYAEHDLYEIIRHHRDKVNQSINQYTVKSLLWQLLNGLNYLHSNWIMHRDLKPSNILVMGDGEEHGVVKVADFGLARIYQSPLKPLAENGVVVTIWYRAPELLLGSKHYTSAVDTWAVGCIFAELLTLKPLFQGQEVKGTPNPFQLDQLDKIFKVLGMSSHTREVVNPSSIQSEPESACGERCLNVLTYTECTPGYCPCNIYCKDQKFQRREYAKMKLFKTQGRGWGLLADEDVQAGCFIIEYCGEVISSQEAHQRSQTYEAEGFKESYIISLNSNNYIDATKKGSLARFINHSWCEWTPRILTGSETSKLSYFTEIRSQPNCETRKWNVSGETRVGIFAIVDICAGTELAYDYNFEWYGGATVRCLCGAANCSKFLGARSQGFLEYNHVWVEGDERYQVEEVPIYDSAEDEPFLHNPNSLGPIKFESLGGTVAGSSIPMEGITSKEVKPEALENNSLIVQDVEQKFRQTSEMFPRLRSTSVGRNFNTGVSSSKKKTPEKGKQKKRSSKGSQTTINFAELFQLKETQDEIRKYEESKKQATSKLQSLYDEIRPVIEQHERNSQDSVPASIGQQWIGAQCNKYKADLDFNFSFIKKFLHATQNGGAGMQAPNAAAAGGMHAPNAGGGAGTSAQGGAAGLSYEGAGVTAGTIIPNTGS